MFDHLFLKSLRDRRRGLIGWISGIVGLVAIQMAVYPTVRDSASDWGQATESFPEVMKEMFRITDYTSETGYLSTELLSFMVPFIFMGLGASWGSRLVAEDEEARTADVLFALPMSRRSILLTRASAAISALLMAATAFVVAVGQEEGGLARQCGRWIHQGIEDHLIGGDARQVQVLAAPIHQLPCAHVIAVAPEESVELVADGTGPQLVGQ